MYISLNLGETSIWREVKKLSLRLIGGLIRDAVISRGWEA